MAGPRCEAFDESSDLLDLGMRVLSILTRMNRGEADKKQRKKSDNKPQRVGFSRQKIAGGCRARSCEAEDIDCKCKKFGVGDRSQSIGVEWSFRSQRTAWPASRPEAV